MSQAVLERPRRAVEQRRTSDFKVSIVIPVYNEEGTIARVISRVCGLPIPKEVIVVDDGSTDETLSALMDLASSHRFKLISKSANEGKGAALRTGFAAASGDVVVVQDADLEYDPGDIVALVRPILNRETNVCYGSRFLAAGDVTTHLHRLGNRMLTQASNLVNGLRLTDMETCYKAFHRDVISLIDIKQDRFGFEPEITAKVARRGHRITEVPISYSARGYREGKKIGMRDAVNAVYCIVRYGVAD